MNRLKELREDNDISINKLLKLLNVSRTTYYNYENELTFPSFNTLLTLADFYGVSIDYLLGYKCRKVNKESKDSLVAYMETINADNKITPKEKESIKLITDSFIKNKR